MTTKPLPLPLCGTDGGRSFAHPQEKNDCTIRATAIAFGVPYEEVHAHMAEKGRRPRHKTRRAVWEPVILQYGAVSHSYYGGKRMTLARFLRENPTGRWVLHMRGHVTAVVDGVILDSSHQGAKRWILKAYQVTKVPLEPGLTTTTEKA